MNDCSPEYACRAPVRSASLGFGLRPVSDWDRIGLLGCVGRQRRLSLSRHEPRVRLAPTSDQEALPSRGARMYQPK